jgi:hypothetical protein
VGREKGFAVQVNGIRYGEFAKVKWQQFLRLYTVLLLLVVAALAISYAFGYLPEEIPVSGGLALLLVFLALLALFRGTIKGEYKKSGIAGMQLIYRFDKDGWTVKSAQGQVTVAWKQTWRVRRNPNALLLYPNRKSVNIVPLRDLDEEQLGKIISWCTGRKIKN